MWQQIDWSDVAAVIMSLVALYTVWTQRRNRASSAHKDDADAAEKLTQAGLSLVEPLNKRVDDLERDLKKEKAQRAADNARNEQIISDLRAEVVRLQGMTCVLANRCEYAKRGATHEGD